ncbi:phage antirepressor [Streptomyces sp. NPDC088733]|uniref:phage antirepressor n=1 Tax=Streptomyces sp. NPDC088733 TaxID=3365880 RepID=UPI003815548D
MSTIIPPPNTLAVFDVSGSGIRFGRTEDGSAYAVASDFAKTMGYRDAANALRILDEDEKGTQIVSTPGGPQQMKVIYEDGMWELIFRSTLPGAKAIKARVKAILREIRETGRYAPAPMDELELAERNVQLIKEKRAAEARVAELEPVARSWQVLASGEGDYAVADAAKILSRDEAISIGRTRLFALLAEYRWTYRQQADDKPRAYQAAIERGWLSELPQSYEHPHSGELVLTAPQVRVTAKGLHELHKRLGGAGVLAAGGAR